MEKGAFLDITVPNPHRNSDRRAGKTTIKVQHSRRIVMLAGLLAPDVDPLFDEVVSYVAWYKPDLIICLGRMVHDRAFQLLVPKLSDEDEFEDEPPLAPEVKAARRFSDVWEERVLELGRLLGKNVFVRLAEAAGPQCKLVYIPALEGSQQNLPPESTIKDILVRTQRRVNAWRQASARRQHSEFDDVDDTEIFEEREFDSNADLVIPVLPTERKDFARLLGIDSHPQIFVLPFGSHITLECMVGDPLSNDDEATRERKSRILGKVRVEVGKRRIMNPITEAYNAMILNRMSTILGYPANLSNGWVTKLLGENMGERTYLMFSQIGMLFARDRVPFGDSALERYATGFWVGYNWRGSLHGKAVPFLRAPDGRRTAMLWRRQITEETPGGLGSQATIELD